LGESEEGLAPEEVETLRFKFQEDAWKVMLHLSRTGQIPVGVLGKLWGDSLHLSFVDLDKTLFQMEALCCLPEESARKLKVIPIYKLEGVITLAMADPLNRNALLQAEQITQCGISPVFAFPEQIDNAIDIQYQSGDTLNEVIARIESNTLYSGEERITAEQLEKFAGDQSVVELTRTILLLSLKERASDIHIDPQEEVIYVRFRIDGVLHDRLKLDKSLGAPLTSRLKVIAKMDITERRKPQDGRIRLEMSHRSLDFRISTLPTLYGEKVVMRSLGLMRAEDIPSIDGLDLSYRNYEILRDIVDTPNGIFFVTGPTGSGKTTTLFSVLKHLNRPGVNVMTVEDPIEYRLPRANQVQVNAAIGFDFGKALRSFLRQDPDVILIGEIRDLETAKIASQAALTGHLVLATIHTNSALQAVTRLVEIGVEPFLVAPSIIGVMAQRLVRRICPHCKEAYQPSVEVMDKHFMWDRSQSVTLWRGKGCLECQHTGYLGRIAIQEIFIITDAVRELIAKGASILDINQSARGEGFRPMRYDGLKKVLMGLTTLDEVERVTAAD
jgi:type IV pilus assembly protein PilB